MIDMVMAALWFILGGYSFWLLTRAKKPQPLTLDELVILWKIHRHQTGCASAVSKVEPVMDSRTKEFSGFMCECGYQYRSKRLIVQRQALERNMFAPKSFGTTESASMLKTHINRNGCG